MCITIFNHQLYQCFVMPALCKDLKDAGLTDFTTHQWRIAHKETVLVTSAFDHDDYYVNAKQLLDKNADIVLPAYTLKDVEKVLPGYLLATDELGNYELCLQTFYRVDPVKAPRMPDAFALMVLHLLQQGILIAENINQQIAKMV